MEKPGDPVWFEFVESKIFSKQIREVSGHLLTRMQSDLVENPWCGAVVKGTHGVRKARVADPASGRAVREEVIDIFTFTLNTLVGFTCSTSSAREIRVICHRSKN